MDLVEELQQDVEEMKTLHATAQRTGVKTELENVLRLLEERLARAKQPPPDEASKQVPTDDALRPIALTKMKPRTPGCYDVKVTNYAWDQSDKFLKIYVTLPGVHTIKEENVKCQYTVRSMELFVGELDRKNHNLLIVNLLQPIIPEASYQKIKKDMVVIFMKKETPKQWSHVTVQENKAKENKTPKLDDGANPSQSLMEMMKQMYEDGDDEMKRTIAKAWTESREKNQDGGFGEF